MRWAVLHSGYVLESKNKAACIDVRHCTATVYDIDKQGFSLC